MKPIQIPKLRDQNKTLADLEDRQDKLGARLQAIEAERLAVGRAQEEQHPADPASARIAALLGETAPTIEPTRREQLAKLAQDARDLRTAMDQISGQIRVERSRASAAIRELVAPEYKRRILAVVAAARAAHEANSELQQLKDELEGQDVEWSALGVVGLGHPRDPYTAVGRFFADAAEYGFIARRDIPEALRR